MNGICFDLLHLPHKSKVEKSVNPLPMYGNESIAHVVGSTLPAAASAGGCVKTRRWLKFSRFQESLDHHPTQEN
jgi:hypothetical protein